MSASFARGTNLCPIRRSNALAVGACLSLCGLVGVTSAGCSPAVPPAPAVKPAVIHNDHDHADHAQKGSGEQAGHADHAHEDHDHTHPETLAAGVAELETMWGHVKEALKAGDREKADDKVHAVGHLLEDFEALLAKEDAGLQEVGKKATEVVFECFDTLDTALHGGEDELKKIDVDELATRVEAAIESLKTVGKTGSR
jgi:hypothetical protein